MKRSIYVGIAVLTAAAIAGSTRNNCKSDNPDKTTCSSHGGGSGGHGGWGASGSSGAASETASVARGGFGASAGAHGGGGE